MNSRSITIGLLVATLILLGAAGYMVFVLKTSPIPSGNFPRTRVVTNTVTQIAVRKVNATNFLAALANRPLSWAAIESTNYQVYINNLRAFGCPAETIKDIILTDVAKLYAKRRAALRAQLQPVQFWQTGDAWESGAAANPELQRRLRELDKEQRALVKELLGAELQTEMAKYWNDQEDQERMYGFLPAEKREKIQELQAQFDELEQDIYARTKGFMLDEDQSALRKLQKQREEELAKILTPEELEEYQLRNSTTASSLRSQLAGFQPTEEEFRKLFRLQKTFDDEFNQAFDPADDQQTDIRARAQDEAQQTLNDEIKKTLGEQRYAEYQRAQDNDYRTLVQLTDRFELSRDLANKVFDMKQDAERQKQRVEANPNLTQEQRQAALAAIARETERAVAQTMGGAGGKTWKAYQKTGGQWITNLGISAEPVAPPPTPVQTFPFPFPFPPLPVPPTQTTP